MLKYIYTFGSNVAEGNKSLLDQLGSKGSNIAELTNLGIPVPSGFTLTSESSKFFITNNFSSYDKFIFNTQFSKAIKHIEKTTKSKLSSLNNPCILSVRSGSKHSMPGMMDTVLNLGFNEHIVKSMSKNSDEFFVYDCYRRFLQSYSTVVLKIPVEEFEEELEKLEINSTEGIKRICFQFKSIIERYNKVIPDDAQTQLTNAITAVYLSWKNNRAEEYRQRNNISIEEGTAVTIQTMVYGNRNSNSLTGVIFTRDCLNGKNNLTGEYLINAQGEDIVSGYKTPLPLSKYSSKELAKKLGYSEKERLTELLSYEETNPILYEKLNNLSLKIEAHYNEVQDIEFTVDDGKIWILQTRKAKRTKKANIEIQKNLLLEGKISKEEFSNRTDRFLLDEGNPLKISSDLKSITSGIPVSSGIAVGQIVFSSEDATKNLYSETILVREQTETEDIAGIYASKGILTAKGGTTSHAAVVCRGINKPCIVGAKVYIDSASKELRIGEVLLKQGDWLTIDADSGQVFLGKIS